MIEYSHIEATKLIQFNRNKRPLTCTQDNDTITLNTSKYWKLIMNIVVTGSTKGIGKAIVERFANEGWNVAICARTQADLDVQLEQLKLHGNEVIMQACDMSKKAEVNAFADLIKSKWNRVDVLVNNAGFFLPGLIHEEEDGVLESQINTNLYSAYYLTKAILPLMMPQKKGHVFNVCSVASLQAYENGGSYSISKFAMYGFSKVLREEMKSHGIRVTSLLPGAVLTNSWAGTTLPEHRFMKVEDVAELVWSIHSLSNQTVVEDVVLRPLEGDI